MSCGKRKDISKNARFKHHDNYREHGDVEKIAGPVFTSPCSFMHL